MFYHLCNRTATVTLSLLVMTLQINAFFFCTTLSGLYFHTNMAPTLA